MGVELEDFAAHRLDLDEKGLLKELTIVQNRNDFDVQLRHQRKISVLTEFELAVQTQISGHYRNLKCFAAAANKAEARDFKALGMTVIIERGQRSGADIAAAVLVEPGHAHTEIEGWRQQQEERDAEGSPFAAAAV